MRLFISAVCDRPAGPDAFELLACRYRSRRMWCPTIASLRAATLSSRDTYSVQPSAAKSTATGVNLVHTSHSHSLSLLLAFLIL
jgi:hypothetical protein